MCVQFNEKNKPCVYLCVFIDERKCMCIIGKTRRRNWKRKKTQTEDEINKQTTNLKTWASIWTKRKETFLRRFWSRIARKKTPYRKHAVYTSNVHNLESFALGMLNCKWWANSILFEYSSFAFLFFGENSARYQLKSNANEKFKAEKNIENDETFSHHRIFEC